ncbi:MAG: helix-turn-helix transcriptional regulator, partial [Spirochaetota bacterium]
RNIPDAIGTAFVLAEIRMAQGHLRDAASTLGQALQFVVDQGKPLPPDTAELYRGLSELYCERGELDSAQRYLSAGKELDGGSELLGQQQRLRVSEALMKQSLGDLDGALDLLYEAEHLYISSPLPVVRPIPALRARIWIAQGKLAEALNWVLQQGLSIDDELSYVHEFEPSPWPEF